MQTVPRMFLIRLLFATFALSNPALSSPIQYELLFSGSSSVGPGQFVFDTNGVASVVLDPPVHFPGFSVLVGGIPFFAITPADDSLIIGPNGFVSALNVDVELPTASVIPPETLQLTEDLNYRLFNAQKVVIGSGTYSTIPTPEPAAFAIIAGGIGFLLLARLRHHSFPPT